MKKLFAIVLAVAMIAAMAIAVSAEETTNKKSDTFEAINVTTTYSARTDVHAYKVTLTYANLTFAYGAGSREWNAETMEWGADKGAAWGNKTGTITITNQSSEDITATFAMVDTASDGVTMAMTGLDDENKVVVGNALPTGEATKGTAKTATVTVTAEGTPTVAGTLATITVSIA